MSLPLRPLVTPRCLSCARSYAFAAFNDLRPTQQQARGKKKAANISSAVPVRLLKDLKTFGRKGAIVPISLGQMRNQWYPRRIAEYVTYIERKELKTKNFTAERDVNFGLEAPVPTELYSLETELLGSEQPIAPVQKAMKVEQLTPERSIELLSILLPPRLQFYRQPIEQPPPEPTPPTAEKNVEQQGAFASGAAADLFAARTPQIVSLEPPKLAGAQAIYGSVSSHDVLMAVRASLVENDEASRVTLLEEDIMFVNTAEGETDRLKHIGDFNVELRVKGAEHPARKVVRVIAQDL